MTISPGIYDNISDREYRAIGAVSQSILKQFSKSAKAAKESRDWPRDSDAFRLGNAADTLLFRPAEYEERYIEYAGSYLKDGTTWTEARRGFGWELFKKEADEAGKIVLASDEAKEVRTLADACLKHETAATLLSGGQAHLVVIWEDDATGLLCKAQLDYWQDDCRRINDVKTTRNIEPKAWAADSFKFGYHVQAAFYIDGLAKALGISPGEIAFTDIAIEKNTIRPDVVCYEVPRELVAYGRKQYQGWLEQYAECEASGEWPGIAERGFMMTEVPAWAERMVRG